MSREGYRVGRYRVTRSGVGPATLVVELDLNVAFCVFGVWVGQGQSQAHEHGSGTPSARGSPTQISHQPLALQQHATVHSIEQGAMGFSC